MPDRDMDSTHGWQVDGFHDRHGNGRRRSFLSYDVEDDTGREERLLEELTEEER